MVRKYAFKECNTFFIICNPNEHYSAVRNKKYIFAMMIGFFPLPSFIHFKAIIRLSYPHWIYALSRSLSFLWIFCSLFSACVIFAIIPAVILTVILLLHIDLIQDHAENRTITFFQLFFYLLCKSVTNHP